MHVMQLGAMSCEERNSGVVLEEVDAPLITGGGGKAAVHAISDED